ncbi:MAG: hypothetical protein HWE15_02250 [Algoriphagus sp.]|uniref:hypothetical protein n=1 Tax=Algoriphagus sp. TaxID=1872435 RepID=UPI0017C037FE|nr:hypothetical protein [Algoriphagus sp.]NVJ85093.1 hypothetical protein [Algoriphagus sp.]
MHTKENVFRLYPNLGYWLMGLIPLTIAGFFVTYISKITFPQPGIVHIHFILMALWLGMIVSQPLLIRYKKVKAHRSLGKLSYILVPLVIISTWLMMRHSYQVQLLSYQQQVDAGMASVNLQEAQLEIAAFLSIAFIYLFWLIVFYYLAIIYRKKPSLHARWIIAASLTFLGPTIDRILIFLFDIYYLAPGIPVEVLAFVLIDMVLIFLIWKDIRKGQNILPFGFALTLYLLLQLFHLTLNDTALWEKFVRFSLA